MRKKTVAWSRFVQFNYTLFYTSFKSKERPAKINFMPAKLHAVLVSTESDCCALYKSISDFRKILIRDSALC